MDIAASDEVDDPFVIGMTAEVAVKDDRSLRRTGRVLEMIDIDMTGTAADKTVIKAREQDASGSYF